MGNVINKIWKDLTNKSPCGLNKYLIYSIWYYNIYKLYVF